MKLDMPKWLENLESPFPNTPWWNGAWRGYRQAIWFIYVPAFVAFIVIIALKHL